MAFQSARPNINWPMHYEPATGKWYHVISGTRREGGPFPQIPGPTAPRPFKKPWRPTQPTPKQTDIAVRVLQRRAMEQAQRQAEQARARERVHQEGRERQREAQRARQREQQTRQAIERGQQQQREQRQRIQQEVLREFQARLARNKAINERLNFERQRRARESQKAGTWLGTTLAGMVPPGITRWAKRRPWANPMAMHGVQGKELIFAQAQRVAKQVQEAMEEFNFWVGQATNVTCAALDAAGGYIGSVGATQALQTLKKPISAFLTRQIASSSARMAREVGRKSTDQVLMRCRNEAYRITRKLFQQDLAAKATERPQRYGEIIDAVFKSLVHQAKRDGILPKSIRTAPPPLAISGTKLPKGGAVDVWDSATGIGWDVTKATVRDVADHDVRYLLGRTITRGKHRGNYVPPRNVMPDGTRLRDIRPLVYPKDWK